MKSAKSAFGRAKKDIKRLKSALLGAAVLTAAKRRPVKVKRLAVKKQGDGRRLYALGSDGRRVFLGNFDSRRRALEKARGILSFVKSDK